MSWKYSNKQKEWIKRLIGEDRIQVLDVLEWNWSIGQLEISTFQQKVVLHLDANEFDEMDRIVVQIIEVCDLFRQLSDDGFIRVWDELPMNDNTRFISEKADSSKPHYIPDLGVATELLRWTGKKIQLKEQILPAAKMNFNDPAIYHARQNRKLVLLSSFILVLLLLGGGLYFNQVLDSKIDMLQDEISNNWKDQGRILDSMNLQLDNLYSLNYQMSLDSQEMIELRVVSDAVDRSINRIDDRSSALQKRLEINQEILKSSDSLLRRLSK